MRLNNGIEIYGYVYKVLNKINGKCYIGQSTKEFNLRYRHKGYGAERVFKYQECKKNRGTHYNEFLLNDFYEFGVENFELIYPLDVAFSEAELDLKERHYISLYKSNIFEFGYNKHSGGKIKGGYYSKETIEKMRVNGKRIWIEHYDKLMNSRPRGEKHSFYNKHHKEETRKKISDSLMGRYASSNNPTSIKVICLDNLKIYDCIRDIERELNIQNQNISKCCKGKRKSAGKKKFMYLEDYNYCIENSIDFDLYKKEKYLK